MVGEKVETIYEGKGYFVECVTKNPDRPFVVNFTAYSERDLRDSPLLARQSHMRRLALGTDYNYVGVVPHMSDWYQRPEIDDVAAAILAATKGRKRIGYGQSMGGYGILNNYHQLKLSHIVLVAPNATCRRELVPWDDRMPTIDKELTSRGIVLGERDFALTSPPITSGFILFDPYNLDGKHARLILEHHPMTALPLRFCGHAPITMLRDLELDEKWLLRLLKPASFDKKEFMAEVREAAADSAEFNHNFAVRMAERNWNKSALAAAQKSASQKKNFAPALLLVAAMQCRVGEYTEAYELLAKLAKHPKHAPKAMSIMAEFVYEIPDRRARAVIMDMLKKAPGGEIALAKGAEAAAARSKVAKPVKAPGLFGGLMSKVFG